MHKKHRTEIVYVKLSFWPKTSRLLGRTITPNGVSPQVDKVKNCLEKLNFPKYKQPPKIHQIPEILQHLYTTTLRKTQTLFQTTERFQQNLHLKRTHSKF